jgi:hypothetical protein
MTNLLGFYQDFPEIPHAKATFTSANPAKTLQKAVAKVAGNLNTQEFVLETIAHATQDNCNVGFELGIAEATTFNYLTSEEVDRFIMSLTEKSVLNIDLLCIVKYHLASRQKRRPLKFDYYLLRFIFRRSEAQLRVFHERGAQHLSIEELVEFLTKQINIELEKMKAKPLRLETIRHPVPIGNL